MIKFTSQEIREQLDALREKHGPGYSDDPAVGKLQAKLSIMLEAALRAEEQQKK